MLIRRAQPDQAAIDTFDILKDISAPCYLCQQNQNGSKRIWVSFKMD